jgi:hypothetical protein
MKSKLITYPVMFWVMLFMFFMISNSVKTQNILREIISYEEYAEEFLEGDEVYLSTLEEWQNVIDQWLEKPLCINNDEAEWLVEYKIISLYQLNKLKEYRFIYGNLLSVYELEHIDGWDFQTARKVMPLVTTELSGNGLVHKKFSFRSFRHNLVLKTGLSSERSKGYKRINGGEDSISNPFYTGTPARFALRYDLEYRNRLMMGIRMEKDPGEPFLVPDSSILKNLKTPDLLSGYLHVKQLGPVQSIIAGNYRVSFGYGINLGGGQSGIKGRNGMAGMANRISPQTSVSETGYFRGIAFSAGLGRISFTGFVSTQNLDGTSVLTDSTTGNPISFSSINKSGLHRSTNELSGRKTINEKVAGSFLVYRNNWLKAGIIVLYNRFSAAVQNNSKPYAKFGLTGYDNLVGGFATTIWLPKIQFLAETSVSRNKSMAFLTGIQLTPVPGALIAIAYRKFAVDYQNWYGSGFVSSGRNSNEMGLQMKVRIELPKKYLLEFLADESESQWISYDLAAPARTREIKCMAEKAWPRSRILNFTFRYLSSSVKDPENSTWICRPVAISQYKLRAEGRIEVMEGVRLKSRVECNLVQGLAPGWLIFQDIEFAVARNHCKIWLRACFFEIMEYESRIYAYENDVLYDFSSFSHYGKGLRGVLMFKISPALWMDLWFRVSTVYYTNKYIGTGWDAIEGNRQNEAEFQVRLRWPD